MKILILGMGNPILSDDGVGLLAAEKLRGRITGADIASSTMIGLSLFDLIIGYDVLFIIDALISQNGHVGRLKKIKQRNGYGTLHLFSSHGLNIFDLMKLGRRCGYAMPHLAEIYGIEIESPAIFSEKLSPALHERLPVLVEKISADINACLGKFSNDTKPRRKFSFPDN
jgi:hydrogenase maturation protease